MLRIKNLFSKQNKSKYACTFMLYALFAAFAANAADLVARPTARPAAPRPSTAAAAATIKSAAAVAATHQSPVADEIAEPEIEEMIAIPEPEPITITESRPNAFSAMLEGAGFTSQSDSVLANTIRQQLAALDIAEATAYQQMQFKTLGEPKGENNCDDDLRTCMQKNCDKDFTKCAGDTDAIFGGKMESCRRNTKCTAREFNIFAAEIKADRDANSLNQRFREVITCGTDYMDCIAISCGAAVRISPEDVRPTGNGFVRCIPKSGGDRAIADCANIAKRCQSADSGLPARMMGMFAALRVDTEKDIADWEKQLANLRAKMRKDCERAGGIFDDISLSCVFTVEFWTSQNMESPMATRKIGPGATFWCTPDWFGVNVTNAMENAARMTTAATGATNALLGMSVQAVGMLASGAPQEAWEKYGKEKEEKAAAEQKLAEECKKPEKINTPECAKIKAANEKAATKKTDADKKELEKKCKDPKNKDLKECKDLIAAAATATVPAKAWDKMNNNEKKDACEKGGGEYANRTGCTCKNTAQKWDEAQLKCVDKSPEEIKTWGKMTEKERKKVCEAADGKFIPPLGCNCKDPLREWKMDQMKCVYKTVNAEAPLGPPTLEESKTMCSLENDIQVCGRPGCGGEKKCVDGKWTECIERFKQQCDDDEEARLIAEFNKSDAELTNFLDENKIGPSHDINIEFCPGRQTRIGGSCGCENGGRGEDCNCAYNEAELNGQCTQCPSGKEPNADQTDCESVVTGTTSGNLAGNTFNADKYFTPETNYADIIKASWLHNSPSITVTEKSSEKGTIEIGFDGVLFGQGKYNITKEAEPILDNVLKWLNETLEKPNVTGVTFVIVGHASTEGSVSGNQTLSVNRANAVKKYLESKLPVQNKNKTIISTAGRGSANVIMNNDNTENKEASRRVEIDYVIRTTKPAS